MLDTLVAAVGAELADAIAIALALDPRDRYQTAREMGRAIDDGARGISPGEPSDGSAAADRRPRRRAFWRRPGHAGPSRWRLRRGGCHPPASAPGAAATARRRSWRRPPPPPQLARRPPAWAPAARDPRAAHDRRRDRRRRDRHRPGTDEGRAAQRRLLRRPGGLLRAQTAGFGKHQIERAHTHVPLTRTVHSLCRLAR